MAEDRSNSKSGKIRVRRTVAAQSQDGRRDTHHAVRISQRGVRRTRIHQPEGGSEIEGANVSLKGAANPGDTLRVEVGETVPVTCQVKPDGLWAMPELALPPGTHEVNVVNVSHPSQSASVRLHIFALRPISVVAPLPGETLEAKLVEVTGKACPERLVCLRLGRSTLTERADSRGSFRFRDVELTRWGDQRLSLFYAEDPGQGAVDLELHWPGLDLPSLVDPVTRAQLEPGADVVRRTGCYTYCYRATWNRLRRCPRCAESTDFWERTAASFHTPRGDLRVR